MKDKEPKTYSGVFTVHYYNHFY